MASAAATITAVYVPPRDASPATQWLLYITSGAAPADPDPAIDSPTVVAMTANLTGIRTLSHQTGAVGSGHTVKVIVRTRRVDAGPVNVDSTNSTVFSVVVASGGPAAPTSPEIEYNESSI